jgi:hypothetical protein
MPTPSSLTDTELTPDTEPLPSAPEAPNVSRPGRRPAWWRRALARGLRGAANAVRPGEDR